MNFQKAPLKLLLLLLLASTSSVVADEPARQPAAKRSERVARARWTPTRSESAKPASKPQSGQVRLASGANNETGLVRQVQETQPQVKVPETLPAPQPVPMQQPMPMHESFSGPMEGEIIYEGDSGFHGLPMETALSCDSMMCGGSGCGGCGGVGCDAGVFCDSPGWSGQRHRGPWRPCLTICLPQDGWVELDYLLWWQKGMYLPPMVTQNNAGFNFIPRSNAPGAPVIVSGNRSDYVEGEMNGLRLRVGVFLDACHRWALVGDYFGFDTLTEREAFNGVFNGPSLGREFFNASEAGAPLRALVINGNAGPHNVVGNINVNVSSQLVSGGFHFRRLLFCSEGCGDTIFTELPARYQSRFSLGVGYRYTQLDEHLQVNDFFTVLDNNNQLTNITTARTDLFDTRTQFNGFDFGLFYTRQRGRWDLSMEGRIAVGVNHQTVSIDGQTTLNNAPGQPPVVVQPFGFLALPTNIIDTSRDRFSVLPEFRVGLGYQFNERWRANVGYTFMYWSNVARPGEYVNPIIEAAQTGPAPPANPVHPIFRFAETDYWAQGISFGGEYRW